MGVIDRLAFAKMPLRILFCGNRIAAAAAGGGTSDAFKQLTNGGDYAPQHSRILARPQVSWVLGDTRCSDAYGD